MTNEQKKALIKEMIQKKVQEFGTNYDGLFDFMAEAALMTPEQINTQILAYAQAKKAEIDANLAALEAQKLAAQKELTKASNETAGVITQLGGDDGK